MDKIQEFYEQAFSGDKVDTTEVINYIKSFKKIVLWVSNLDQKELQNLRVCQTVAKGITNRLREILLP